MSVVETEAIRVRTIDHVTIVVTDIQRSTEFYTKVLGMQQAERPNFGFPGAWFQAGNTQIHLVLQNEKAGSAGIGEFDGSDPSLSSVPANVQTALARCTFTIRTDT
jgi:catechol 2,3-dioxygenase-like lactoylglutathione lyase family enzyme